MRVIRLAALAARSEQARLSLRLRRAVWQLALLALGLAFVVGGVIALHLAAFALLDARLPRAGALGCVAGFDLLAALVLLWRAAGSQASASEREAEGLSRAATAGIEDALSSMRLLETLLGWALNRKD